MDLRVDGPINPKKGPLGQESETYKWRQLESSREITFIILNNVFSI